MSAVLLVMGRVVDWVGVSVWHTHRGDGVHVFDTVTSVVHVGTAGLLGLAIRGDGTGAPGHAVILHLFGEHALVLWVGIVPVEIGCERLIWGINYWFALL